MTKYFTVCSIQALQSLTKQSLFRRKSSQIFTNTAGLPLASLSPVLFMDARKFWSDSRDTSPHFSEVNVISAYAVHIYLTCQVYNVHYTNHPNCRTLLLSITPYYNCLIVPSMITHFPDFSRLPFSFVFVECLFRCDLYSG